MKPLIVLDPAAIELPQIGSRVYGVDDPDVRRLPVHTFPYQIVFLKLPDRTEVVAFAHHRRRPAYYIDRIAKR